MLKIQFLKAEFIRNPEFSLAQWMLDFQKYEVKECIKMFYAQCEILRKAGFAKYNFITYVYRKLYLYLTFKLKLFAGKSKKLKPFLLVWWRPCSAVK